MDLSRRFAQILKSRLLKQNVVLFAGGLFAAVGSFAYYAIAGRELGPSLYGQLASLISFYSVGTAPAVTLSVLLARHAATNGSRSHVGIRSLTTLTMRLVAIPSLAIVVLAALIARPVSAFVHIESPTPVLIVAISLALVWQLAIPRGILQGLQRFTALSVNLSLELVIRTGALLALLAAGMAVSGAMSAVSVGLGFSLLIGLYALRDQFSSGESEVSLRALAGFSLTAAVGTLGVQLLYNQDVVLAQHFLKAHDGGIYGALSKVGAIVFQLTLSVSQVLFPRVVEAVAKQLHAGRMLLASAGVLCGLGVGLLLVFAAVPSVVVGSLFGPGFEDAAPYVLAIGVIGLALSLDNLLVQFLMAIRDRSLVPILISCCLVEAGLIVLFHAGLQQVVVDVLTSMVALLMALSMRCYFVLRTRHSQR